MNVYVESNFVLELVRLQGEHEACAAILEGAERGDYRLILPAFSLAEPHWTLEHSRHQRRVLWDQLNNELRQLDRTAAYSERLKGFRDLTTLLIQSADEEAHRLDGAQARLLEVAEEIPLNAAVLTEASRVRARTNLKSHDAIVYASILSHLARTAEETECVFLTRDTDFDDPTLGSELEERGCKLLLSFRQGLNYLSRGGRNL